jgi:hypothetical protein
MPSSRILREKQPDQPTVQEAIRRLTDKALACEAARGAT